MTEVYRFLLTMLLLLWFQYWMCIKGRTALEVRRRFSKNNIKKKKRGFLNRLLYLKFHRERPLGTWYYLNFISFVCLLALTVLYLICCCFHINAVVCIVFFIPCYLFLIPVSLVADVKATEWGFSSKPISESMRRREAHISTGIRIIIIIAFSVVASFYFITYFTS